MKEPLLGILGGMSWQSTETYYREINRAYQERIGGHSSAPILIHSVDFGPVEAAQRNDDWPGAAEILLEAARSLQAGGAGTILLATNTMHLLWDELTAATSVPWIHIADAVGTRLAENGYRTVGLLGTRFTMERNFYRKRLTERFGMNVLIPDADDRAVVDGVIFNELVHGAIRAESRERYRSVIADLAADGAEAVILGCTEIGMLTEGHAFPLPLFDTTLTHVAAAVNWLLEERT